MLERVLEHLNNWFLVPDGVHSGTFTIEDGGIVLPFLSDGQYYRVIGSVFNDGLHQHGAADLTDETFEGSVWALAVRRAVVELAAEMAEYVEKNPPSPYQSESFGGYSYTRGTNMDGNYRTVWDVYADRLQPYRKQRELAFVQPTRPRTPEQAPYNPYPWR